ncbi:PepSY-associated TM helix domain-containing protein [Umezawaea sp.]|uniref:PepSY-associated TM helix domain-containing protein n=1 Tax=Umezawaea sp. TaxID=1955258 RepID=UPI002ED4AF54
MTTTSDQVVQSTTGLRGLVLRCHFYAGVLVGPFVLVAALTGVLYALTPQLESWLYHGELSVPVSSRPLPLAEQVLAARATNPTGSLVAVRPAPEPGDTTRVLFTEPGLGGSERRAVFVDPGTGRVTGSLVASGTSGVLPLRTALDQVHRNLLLGEPGRLYSELAASWLWVVALGGAVLWLTRSRATRGRRRSLGVHGVLGMWVLLGAVFLSATGLAWSAYAGGNVAAVRSALGWAPPSLRTGGGGEHAGHAADRVDDVLASARAAGIDAGALEIGLPDGPGEPWEVTEVERGWPTQVDAVAVDGASGSVVGSVRFADYPVAAKLARWGVDAHTGVLFGWPNQVLLLAVGLGLVVLVVLGYRMWWRRRPVRATAVAFGKPVARGQWRKASTPSVLVLLVVAGLVGWFVPLLGTSLVAFLVVDVVLGLRARAAAGN